jgi:DinB superfamily
LNNHIETIRKTRIHLLKLIEALSTEELNKIPQGFNNNVIWNLGHLIATQQSICYTRSGIPPFVAAHYFELYKSGTKPEVPRTTTEIEAMKGLFLQAIDQFEKDYEAQVFSSVPAWTTGYGNSIFDIDDAIDFVLFHEGLHRGYIMALKRLLL